nr:MAG TPA: hypothetical protein [Caudoviricetes sp.]
MMINENNYLGENYMSRNVHTEEIMENTEKEYHIDDKAEIIRYMDFSKFMNILIKKEVFFCNAEKFEDKYEGEVPNGFYNLWSDKKKQFYKERDEILNRVAYINCWNNFEGGENYAMWKLYTHPDTGVAIKTTVGHLRKALNDSRVEIYKVKYLDSFDDGHKTLELPFYDHTEDFVWEHVKEACKYRAYEYENEIRALYYDENDDKIGKNIKISVDTLIDEIYISPYAPVWFEELIRDIVNNPEYGLDSVDVNKSSISFR